MAINYTNLFEDVGEVLEVINNLDTLAVTTLPAYESEVTTQFNANSMFALQSGVPEMFAGFQASVVGIESVLGAKINERFLDRSTILDELPVGGLTSVRNVMNLLYRQMIDDSESINGNTVTIGAVSSSLIGQSDGVILTSKVLDGVAQPTAGGSPNWLYLHDLTNVAGSGRLPGEHASYVGTLSELGVTLETMTLTCDKDSESNGTLDGGERFRWKGEVPNSGPFDWRVEGSGNGLTVVVLNGHGIITNGEFETWESSAPSSWDLDSGVAGVDILEETTLIHRLSGTSALELTTPTRSVSAVSVNNPTDLTSTAHGLSVGDEIFLAGFSTTPDINGAQTVSVVADVNTFSIAVNVTAVIDGVGTAKFDEVQLSQTLTNLVPGRRYCVGCWILGEAGIASGALTIQMEGTDYIAGTVEKISMNAAALAAQTSYGVESFFFNAPVEIPSDFELVIKITGTLTDAKHVYIDGLALGTVTYFGGVGVAILAGDRPFILGDKYDFSVSNDDVGVFQKYFREKHKVQFVSDLTGGETIPDSLASD